MLRIAANRRSLLVLTGAAAFASLSEKAAAEPAGYYPRGSFRFHAFEGKVIYRDVEVPARITFFRKTYIGKPRLGLFLALKYTYKGAVITAGRVDHTVAEPKTADLFVTPFTVASSGTIRPPSSIAGWSISGTGYSNGPGFKGLWRNRKLYIQQEVQKVQREFPYAYLGELESIIY